MSARFQIVTGENPHAVITIDAYNEIMRAREKHPGDFRSYHEGFSIIYEEFDELKAEVWKQTPDKPALRKEALHVAAMALRFAAELT